MERVKVFTHYYGKVAQSLATQYEVFLTNNKDIDVIDRKYSTTDTFEKLIIFYKKRDREGFGGW